MNTFLSRLKLWLGFGPSVTFKVLEALEARGLTPSRIVKGEDENGINLYFFKPGKDAYAFIYIDESDLLEGLIVGYNKRGEENPIDVQSITLEQLDASVSGIESWLWV